MKCFVRCAGGGSISYLREELFSSLFLTEVTVLLSAIYKAYCFFFLLNNHSCLDVRNDSGQVQDPSGDYLELITDPWKGSTLNIKDTCFFPNRGSDTQYNHLTDPELSLTFELMASGEFDSGLCDPAVSMAGGSWIGGMGWSGRSNTVVIGHDVVDYGVVKADEYRQVVIPMDKFTEGRAWDLSAVHSISFHYCPDLGSAGQQPK